MNCPNCHGLCEPVEVSDLNMVCRAQKCLLCRRYHWETKGVTKDKADRPRRYTRAVLAGLLLLVLQMPLPVPDDGGCHVVIINGKQCVVCQGMIQC